MTPETHPNRFTDDERACFERGECCWQTSYGTIRGVVFCRADKLTGFHLCAEHACDLAGAYPTDAQRRALEVVYYKESLLTIDPRVIRSLRDSRWLRENALTDEGLAALWVARFTTPAKVQRQR